MKKHAAGFVFFVSVVSLFVAGYAVFRTYPIPDIGVVDNSEDHRTNPDAGVYDVRITQAIADPSYRSLAFSLSNGGSGVTAVDFAFYNVNAEGVRFVRDEVVQLRPEQWTAGNTSSMIRYKTDWLGSKQITDNLYVVARERRSNRPSYELVPFSREKATAVLIAKN